jgi:hypothetical protein
MTREQLQARIAEVEAQINRSAYDCPPDTAGQCRRIAWLALAKRQLAEMS